MIKFCCCFLFSLLAIATFAMPHDLCEDCRVKVHGSIVSRTVDEAKSRTIDVYADGAVYTNSIRRVKPSKAMPQRSAESKPSKPLPTDKLPPQLRRARAKANAQRDGVNVKIVVPQPFTKE